MSLPPADGIATIPLPPGMTLDQFFALQSDLVSIAITTAIAFGIAVWDYFHLLPNELFYYQRSNKSEWKRLAPWAFTTLRCSAVISLFAALCVSGFQSSRCQLALSIYQALAVAVVASSGIVFIYRLMSLWGNNPILMGILVIVYGAMVASWTVVATQYRAATGPSTPFGSNCQFRVFQPWYLLSHASSVIFNTIILIAALLKYVDQRAHQTHIRYKLYLDSLVLIAIETATSISVMVLESLTSDYQVVKQTVLPYSTLVTAATGARMFINFQLARIQPGGNDLYYPAMRSQLLSGNGTRSGGRGMNVKAYVSPGPDAFPVDSKTGGFSIVPQDPARLYSPTPTSSFPKRGMIDDSASPADFPLKHIPPSQNDFTNQSFPPHPAFSPTSRRANFPKNQYTTFPDPPPSASHTPTVKGSSLSSPSSTPESMAKAKFNVQNLKLGSGKNERSLKSEESGWL